MTRGLKLVNPTPADQPQFRTPHEPNLINITFYDRDSAPDVIPVLHVLGVPIQGPLRPVHVLCGKAITPFYNEWHSEEGALQLLSQGSGCDVCLNILTGPQ